jgi:hypothetical protein
MHIGFVQESPERDHQEDADVFRWIITKWIIEK